jgi:XTP/dITP diphosphohydrolase
MARLCVATNNIGKQREFVQLLAGWGGDIVFPGDLGIDLEVDESGASFEENAILKARAYAAASGLPGLADDSGLEVDALGGAPGILSARYAGAGASDQDRRQKLLTALAATPIDRRSARFRCVVAISDPGGRVAVAAGTCEGRIALEPRGTHGFGYDPVFYLPEYGCTMAELRPELKNQISHRARAIQAARPLLDALLMSSDFLAE